MADEPLASQRRCSVGEVGGTPIHFELMNVRGERAADTVSVASASGDASAGNPIARR
jgi:hypothetical protein